MKVCTLITLILFNLKSNAVVYRSFLQQMMDLTAYFKLLSSNINICKEHKCNYHSESCMHLWSLLAFNHSATQWPHAGTVHFLIWLFPPKCTCSFHWHPYIPPLILDQVQFNVVSYLMGRQWMSVSSIPKLAQFLATNKIRLSVSQWFGKTCSTGRYDNHIIQI